ncbi:MAG: hypothetical protein M3547_01390 [Acidobacteriota bacterium]|nr:hypothetical protein [Acidobacteriota bacterium]
MKRLHPAIAATLVLAALWVIVLAGAATQACKTAPLKEGADEKLVRAQQTYDSAVNTANLLFTLEDQNEVVIEKLLPGTHKIVELGRTRAKRDIPIFLKAIDHYKEVRDAVALGEMEGLQKAISGFVDDLQKTIDEINAARKPKPAPTPVAFLSPIRLEVAA